MSTPKTDLTETVEGAIVISRVFEAPRELVWKAWTEPERIVVTDSFSDAEGNVIPASDYGMSGDWPLEMLITVEFAEQDGKTRLTLRHEGVPAGENADMCEAGWNESFDKLAEYLEKETEH